MTVTPESNYALIQQLQDLVSSAAEPPSGPEFSYPVVDQAVSSSMWQWMHRGQGNGVLFAGRQPYWLRGLDNATNTARITVSNHDGTAHAIVDGFFHSLVEDKTVDIPMPTTRTEYHICLTFDPRREGDPAGPIRLEVHAGTPPETFGRKHIILWKITRNPNELLTDSAVERVRPGISPVIAVNYSRHLPDPNSVLNGTLCVTTLEKGLWVARSTNEAESANEWIDLQAPTWRELITNTFEGYGGSQSPHVTLVAGRVTMKGLLRFKNGSNFVPRADGYWILTVPPGMAPTKPVNTVSITSGEANPGFCRVRITTSGEVYVYPSRTCLWVSIDAVEYWVDQG